MSQSTNSTEGSPSPASLNAPRYGTVVPKRIFVGGISANTTEAELHELFSRYGVVTNTKIISDRAGVSKGYGFVTFDTEEEAQRAQASASNLTLRDRRLNIAPAIKKQPFTRVYALSAQSHEVVAGAPSDPAQSVPNGTILYHNGIPYTYHNGMAFFITPEATYQYAGQAPGAATAPATYPVVYQPSVYYPQQAYQYQNMIPTQWATGAGPWRWTPSQNPSSQAATGAYGYPAPLVPGVPPYLGGGGSDSPEYHDPAIVEASAEVGVPGGSPKDDGATTVTTAMGLSSLWAKAASGAPGTPATAAGREHSTPDRVHAKRGGSPLFPSQLCQRGDPSWELSQWAQHPVRRQRRNTAPPESSGIFFQTTPPPQCDGAKGGERSGGAGLSHAGELGPTSSKRDGGHGWRECMFDVPPSTPCRSQRSVCP